MGMHESLLSEFDQEMAGTRKILERVPGDKFDWKPHPRSWSMGSLANHLANVPNWGVITIQQNSFDIAPPGAPAPRNPRANSPPEILELFEKNVSATRAALAGTNDEHLLKPWTLLSGGKAVFVLPRIAALRSFIMNHNVHHRAQLGVYLRLNDVPVPAIYGPTADEGAM